MEDNDVEGMKERKERKKGKKGKKGRRLRMREKYSTEVLKY